MATLFGGALDGIPAYASCGMLLPPTARAESALRLRDEGFRALKIRIDPRAARGGDRGGRARPAAAVGDTMAIMVDLNQGWRMAGRHVAPRSIRWRPGRIAARLAELEVLWLEEPLAGTDLRGLAALRAAVPGIRIAGGEMTRTFRELLAALDADAFDVYQPDVVLAARDAADADRRPSSRSRGTAGSRRTPGRTGSGCWPTCTSRRASAAARTSSSRTTRPAGPRNVATRCSPSRSGPEPDGMLRVPTAPGLGIELDKAALGRFAA